MEPVGMTNACTSVVVPNKRRMMVTVHSAMKPRGGSAVFAFLGDSASVGRAVADFEVSTSFHCNGKRVGPASHVNGSQAVVC